MSSWPTKLLGQLITFQRGFDLPYRERRSGNVPIVTSAGFSDWHDTAVCEAPGVVTGRYGTIGELFYIDQDFWPLNTTLFVRDFKGNDPKFVFYALQRFDFVGFSGKSGVPGVNRNDLHAESVCFPADVDEQKAIAGALSDMDALIEALWRLIAKKRDLRQGAMQRLLTGQTRLPGFTAPWQEKRLGDHVTFLKNGIHSRAQLTHDDPVRYLHYGDIHVSPDLCINVSNADMPRLPWSEALGLTRLQDGDIVFVDASEDLNGVGKSLEIVGAVGVEAVSGQHTIAARFNKSVLADGFKRYLQVIPAFTAHLRRLAAGTKIYATNRKHIASAQLQLPETEEQFAIARVLSDMELEILALEARLNKTRALKQAMMQALLTGRVRLPIRSSAALQPKETAHV
ncbi:restriction endonuclease subunit S [Agrobacterium tumefaciens]|uniref:restriction endonuclease subunit S n=1 Tax=Agrobacterium tumefaciens TaxID=358 RepID=UPI003B9E2CCE